MRRVLARHSRGCAFAQRRSGTRYRGRVVPPGLRGGGDGGLSAVGIFVGSDDSRRDSWPEHRVELPRLAPTRSEWRLRPASTAAGAGPIGSHRALMHRASTGTRVRASPYGGTADTADCSAVRPQCAAAARYALAPGHRFRGRTKIVPSGFTRFVKALGSKGPRGILIRPSGHRTKTSLGLLVNFSSRET
jgi:hypothetical protein